MPTTQADRLILNGGFPQSLVLGGTHRFSASGHLEFPRNVELPLIPGDKNGRPLGAPRTTIQVTTVNYSGEGRTARTSGEYTVVGVLCDAGASAMFGTYRTPRESKWD